MGEQSMTWKIMVAVMVAAVVLAALVGVGSLLNAAF